MAIDVRALVSVEHMQGDDAEDTALLKAAYAEAKGYIERFRWCNGVREAYFGAGVGGVIAAFLVRISPSPDADEWLWLIVGDLPAAYVVTDQAESAAEAIRVYCDLMTDWIIAVKTGASLEEVFPVAAEPTLKNAESLAERISFVRDEVLPGIS